MPIDFAQNHKYSYCHYSITKNIRVGTLVKKYKPVLFKYYNKKHNYYCNF